MIGTKTIQRLRRVSLATAATAMTAAPAFAHHPMGGQTPETFFHGFLSGVGHPIIGLDHLAFVVGVALLSLAFGKARHLMPAAFIVATMAGAGIHLAGIDLPIVEIVVAASVLIAGVLLATGAKLDIRLSAGLFAVAGVFHGFAYGEAIFGAEPTPLFAYLFGFAAIQYGIAAAAMELARRLFSEEALQATWLRVGGGTIAGIAIVFIAERLLPF